MTLVDERLLDFVQQNQLKILGRKNLSREEVKMLQISTIRPKYDKTGVAVGVSVAGRTVTNRYVRYVRYIIDRRT